MNRILLAMPFVLIAGCVSMQTGGGGKHLVYRDAKGAPTLQIDYPTESFCRRVEAIASGNVRCEKTSAEDQLHARATLHYNPPSMDVLGHYPDVAACEKANSRMAQGVQLAKPCSAKPKN
jgi:hypothetical protein